MTLEGMIEAIMEAEIIVQGIQAAAPEEDQVVPVYDAGIAEAGAEDDVMDPADIPIDPEDHPEDPPVIIIESDDEEEYEEEDFDDLEEPEEDPEKILFDHADWDANSDISSDRSIAIVHRIATLQRQLLEQQQETNRLREQIARLNQVPHANEVPLQDNPVPRAAPPAPGVRQGVPRNLEVPLVPDGIQANPPLVREDLLFERFRRMKAPEFEGTTDPIEADNWLVDIQVILDFMGITEREKVLCASFVLKKDVRHWWMLVQMRRDVATMS
ncbi:hypothetical protein TIFTF001_027356 [Ficus carica]|uniref:Uncharacterized protein n=1 Tax=Ficus carica TaxID=3494 RepID=A0AA88DN82_FICCA|nr:hypothetical protein TIFTF001_027356 [Ficus carica]